jgi:putative Ca2+/H+ antiporter (TMEM165/GDT1 family)
MKINFRIKTFLILFHIIILIELITSTSFKESLKRNLIEETRNSDSDSNPNPNDMKTDDFWQSFTAGLTIVLLSGIGDKTFFLCMIYATSNPIVKSFVVSGAIMLCINIINLAIGWALPFIMYKDVIDWIAIVLFTFFGVTLLIEGLRTESKPIEEELESVKNSVIHSHSQRSLVVASKSAFSPRDSVDINNNNNMVVAPSPVNNPNILPNLPNDNNPQEHLLPKDSPDNVGLATFDSFWQFAASLFLAECGDKSQIATIVVSAMHNFYGVMLGTSTAQLISIILSIFAGNILAKKLTNKELSIAGGIMFMAFAVAYLLDKVNVY